MVLIGPLSTSAFSYWLIVKYGLIRGSDCNFLWEVLKLLILHLKSTFDFQYFRHHWSFLDVTFVDLTSKSEQKILQLTKVSIKKPKFKVLNAFSLLCLNFLFCCVFWVGKTGTSDIYSKFHKYNIIQFFIFFYFFHVNQGLVHIDWKFSSDFM